MPTKATLPCGKTYENFAKAKATSELHRRHCEVCSRDKKGKANIEQTITNCNQYNKKAGGYLTSNGVPLREQLKNRGEPNFSI